MFGCFPKNTSATDSRIHAHLAGTYFLVIVSHIRDKLLRLMKYILFALH